MRGLFAFLLAACSDGGTMAVSIYDTAALYLLSYSGTLNLSLWREAVVQLYQELETQYGANEARKLGNKSVAYYCMEIGQSYQGRKAIAKFRQLYKWPDFRNSDQWWKEEWLSRKNFDERVQEIRAKLMEEPSIPPDEIEQDTLGREALYLVMKEATRRHGDYVDENTEWALRGIISIYGGHAVLSLWRAGALTDYKRIPTLLSSYFLERELVATFGDSLITMKQLEYN